MVYEQALPHIYHTLNFPLHQTSDFQSGGQIPLGVTDLLQEGTAYNYNCFSIFYFISVTVRRILCFVILFPFFADDIDF